MTDGGPPALPVPPTPPVPVPPPVIPPVPPMQPIQPIDVPQLNRLHFKPELTGKPDDDAKAHFLRTDGWMDTHVFV